MPSLLTEVPVSTSLLRFDAVRERTGLSRSEIYRRLSANNFPTPIVIRGTRIRVWSSDAIQAWIDAELSAARSLNRPS